MVPLALAHALVVPALVVLDPVASRELVVRVRADSVVVARAERALVASEADLVVPLPAAVALRAVVDRVRHSVALVVVVATPKSSSRRR